MKELDGLRLGQRYTPHMNEELVYKIVGFANAKGASLQYPTEVVYENTKTKTLYTKTPAGFKSVMKPYSPSPSGAIFWTLVSLVIIMVIIGGILALGMRTAEANHYTFHTDKIGQPAPASLCKKKARSFFGAENILTLSVTEDTQAKTCRGALTEKTPFGNLRHTLKIVPKKAAPVRAEL